VNPTDITTETNTTRKTVKINEMTGSVWFINI